MPLIRKDEGRAITLNVPTMFTDLMADSGTLLHEMVHQYLNERGEPPGHDSEGWRREIMRLHELVTGKKIWAGASITKRQDGRVVRISAPSPTGKASLTQRQIARWPHAVRGLHWGRCNLQPRVISGAPPDRSGSDAQRYLLTSCESSGGSKNLRCAARQALATVPGPISLQPASALATSCRKASRS